MPLAQFKYSCLFVTEYAGLSATLPQTPIKLIWVAIAMYSQKVNEYDQEYRNHTLQITPRHREQEQHNTTLDSPKRQNGLLQWTVIGYILMLKWLFTVNFYSPKTYNNTCADQYVQSRYLISSFVIRSLKHDCQTSHLHSLNIRAYL